jgi:NAD(P)-dependent dehydrogenase (short-subunit alcohol dehydrogenase family)
MAVEFAPLGIRANAVAPGWTVTEMHFGQTVDPQGVKGELEQRVHEGCILRRLGRPEEIANAIFFLASDEASYITGTTLHADGGQGLH